MIRFFLKGTGLFSARIIHNALERCPCHKQSKHGFHDKLRQNIERHKADRHAEECPDNDMTNLAPIDVSAIHKRLDHDLHRHDEHEHGNRCF